MKNSIFYFLLFVFISFYNSNLLVLKLVGMVTIGVFLIYLGYLLLIKFMKVGIPNRKLIILILALLLILQFLGDVRSYFNDHSFSVKTLPLLSNIIVIFYLLNNNDFIQRINRQNTIFTLLITIFLVTCLVSYVLSDSPFFSFYMANPNSLGIFMFFLLFFQLFVVKKEVMGKRLIYKGAMLVNIFLIVFFTIISGSRSVLISMVLVILILILWKLLTSNKLFHNAFFLSFLFVIFSTIQYFINNKFSSDVESLVYEITGERLSSGRGEIWLALMPSIKENLLFGLGSNAAPITILGINLSTHNLYLQLVLQSGLLFLVAFVILLICIWNIYYKQRGNFQTALSAAFFCGILLHQTFEVSLTQNNVGVSIIQWTIIMLGVSLKKEVNNEKDSIFATRI